MPFVGIDSSGMGALVFGSDEPAQSHSGLWGLCPDI